MLQVRVLRVVDGGVPGGVRREGWHPRGEIAIHVPVVDRGGLLGKGLVAG